MSLSFRGFRFSLGLFPNVLYQVEDKLAAMSWSECTV